ncbi:MAG: DUF1192 domain-containing protein [Alphaproteobacteria bacterium]|nr:DUF1192 domain-containing protein [Alphaproteobacteria bacterium]
MSLDDNLEPTFQAVKPGFEPMNVEGLSLAELRKYIAHAQTEIQRAESEINSREELRSDADALFKSQ